MRTWNKAIPFTLALWLSALVAHAQNYSIDWYDIGGGGTSSGGQYSLSGAIGQPDAGAMAGGGYSLSGGFLSIGPAAPTRPSIASVTPATGLTNGGTTVTLVGTGFASGVTVNFGAWPALSVEVVNSTELTAVTPPSALGTVSVVVTNADGQSATLSNGFTYTMVAPPVFRAVTQTDGTMNLTWSATAGQKYQVQYKTNLSQPGWTNLVIVTATNSTAGVSDTLNPSAQRFYRTLWLP